MTQNPSTMSNEDLEKDLNEHPQNKEEKSADNNANTSEDPEVEPLEKKSMDMGVDFEENKEQDLDDLVHEQQKITHNGTSPDPEELKFREGQ